MLQESPNEGIQESLRQRDAGAEQVYLRMVEKSETDPEMARLFLAESSKEVEDAVKVVVNEDVAFANAKMTEYAGRLASIEHAKIVMHPDGKVEVEGPIEYIPALIEATKREMLG